MSAIQVKNVPEDLHEALRARAKAEGKTVGEVMLDALRRDLQRQAMREWMAEVDALNRDVPKISDEAFQQLVEESGREMWGEE